MHGILLRSRNSPRQQATVLAGALSQHNVRRPKAAQHRTLRLRQIDGVRREGPMDEPSLMGRVQPIQQRKQNGEGRLERQFTTLLSQHSGQRRAFMMSENAIRGVVGLKAF